METGKKKGNNHTRKKILIKKNENRQKQRKIKRGRIKKERTKGIG